MLRQWFQSSNTLDPPVQLPPPEVFFDSTKSENDYETIITNSQLYSSGSFSKETSKFSYTRNVCVLGLILIILVTSAAGVVLYFYFNVEIQLKTIDYLSASDVITTPGSISRTAISLSSIPSTISPMSSSVLLAGIISTNKPLTLSFSSSSTSAKSSFSRPSLSPSFIPTQPQSTSPLLPVRSTTVTSSILTVSQPQSTIFSLSSNVLQNSHYYPPKLKPITNLIGTKHSTTAGTPLSTFFLTIQTETTHFSTTTSSFSLPSPSSTLPPIVSINNVSTTSKHTFLNSSFLNDNTFKSVADSNSYEAATTKSRPLSTILSQRTAKALESTTTFTPSTTTMTTTETSTASTISPMTPSTALTSINNKTTTSTSSTAPTTAETGHTTPTISRTTSTTLPTTSSPTTTTPRTTITSRETTITTTPTRTTTSTTPIITTTAPTSTTKMTTNFYVPEETLDPFAAFFGGGDGFFGDGGLDTFGGSMVGGIMDNVVLAQSPTEKIPQAIARKVAVTAPPLTTQPPPTTPKPPEIKIIAPDVTAEIGMGPNSKLKVTCTAEKAWGWTYMAISRYEGESEYSLEFLGGIEKSDEWPFIPIDSRMSDFSLHREEDTVTLSLEKKLAMCDDKGRYLCEVKVNKTFHSKTFDVNVKKKPDPPKLSMQEDIFSGDKVWVTTDWDAGFPVIGYLVHEVIRGFTGLVNAVRDERTTSKRNGCAIIFKNRFYVVPQMSWNNTEIQVRILPKQDASPYYKRVVESVESDRRTLLVIDKNICDGQRNKKVAHPYDCNKYIVCYSGGPQISLCPYFHCFDQKKRKCVREEFR